MVREIFYTALKYDEDGNTQHASGVAIQTEWSALKKTLADQGFHIKSWYPIDESPLALA